MHYLKIIENLQVKEEIILFHSATGKDSIMLLDLLSKNFKRVFCVFMYIVPDLEYEQKYITWAEKKYKNVEFYKTPHYCVYSFIKNGYLGIKKNPNQTLQKISKIDAKIKIKTGIEYSCYGFKKIDGITRRLMLNTYKNGIFEKTKKIYPLMDLKNSDVLNYIRENDLIKPFNYGTLKPSSGCDISTPEFLLHIKNKYPRDLEKIFKVFPETRVKLFEYENKAKWIKRNWKK